MTFADYARRVIERSDDGRERAFDLAEALRGCDLPTAQGLLIAEPGELPDIESDEARAWAEGFVRQYMLPGPNRCASTALELAFDDKSAHEICAEPYFPHYICRANFLWIGTHPDEGDQAEIEKFLKHHGFKPC